MTDRKTSIWNHSNPVHITAGIDRFSDLYKFIPEGNTLLITTNGFTRRGVSNKIAEQLGSSRVIIYDKVTPNPELSNLDAATVTLKEHKINSIVALGGGSVLDFAKVLSVTLLSSIDCPLEYYLRQNNPQKWEKKITTIVIPTTSGTGAEVTPFATVWDTKTHAKYSVTGNFVYPSHALLDPVLTLSLPRQQTLFTALDAVSHALESLWNKNRTPISEAFSIQALSLAEKALPVILNDTNNLEYRTLMQESSLLAGFAISQTRTAIAHAISYPLTSYYGVPHGLACSFLLSTIINNIFSDSKCAARLGSSRDIIEKTGYMLLNLNLDKYLFEYLSAIELKGLLKYMTPSERTENFLFDELDIFSIIKFYCNL